MSEYQRTIDEEKSIQENIREKEEGGKSHDGGEDKPERRKKWHSKLKSQR